MSARISAVVVLALAACGGDAARVERARAARYDADRVELVRRAAEEVRKHYSTFTIDQDGTIRTAWHQVSTAGQVERTPSPGTSSAERWFIRFDVTISNERPSSVDVRPFAAKWQTGMALPVELRGSDEPAWVHPRADRLRLQLHEALERYAR